MKKDANSSLTIYVTKMHCKIGIRGDSFNCIAAEAVKEQMGKDIVEDVRIGVDTSTIYLSNGDRVRYSTPSSLRRHLEKFDREGVPMPPGTYKLRPLVPSKRAINNKGRATYVSGKKTGVTPAKPTRARRRQLAK